jgi:hypothetical protein
MLPTSPRACPPLAYPQSGEVETGPATQRSVGIDRILFSVETLQRNERGRTFSGNFLLSEADKGVAHCKAERPVELMRSQWPSLSSSVGAIDFCLSCSIVHCFGFLSDRQRMIVVPCRKRPPVKWSYETSTTNFGLTGFHCDERFVDQRLGAPGVLPVKLRTAAIASSLSVSAGFSVAFNPDVKPT